ncbi:MAG: hypothetical protein GWN18_06955 [Thermoplasmata archaeon]|nr:hypothetical protein [Thermoplasmata archaeon]NIS12768.1 hypothetical protein [Thermoplasmata archaeon]NIS19703.1 hypothetical protein [Thermoplasmata archaeon]NIT76886.1 hypothetical protein [Thermoplasmata archaeon]NIU48814.1 hypothetical protein [Thermoplasmata archaeon]
MTGELSLTMEALEELYLARREMGWSVQVYDYTSNSWREGEEAFRAPGTYERAVLQGPGTRPVRVRVLPSGGGGLSMDPASAAEVGTWRALGVELRGRHLELIGSLLEGRSEKVTVEELTALLRASDDPRAGEVLAALSTLLPQGGGGP